MTIFGPRKVNRGEVVWDDGRKLPKDFPAFPVTCSKRGYQFGSATSSMKVSPAVGNLSETAFFFHDLLYKCWLFKNLFYVSSMEKWMKHGEKKHIQYRKAWLMIDANLEPVARGAEEIALHTLRDAFEKSVISHMMVSLSWFSSLMCRILFLVRMQHRQWMQWTCSFGNFSAYIYIYSWRIFHSDILAFKQKLTVVGSTKSDFSHTYPFNHPNRLDRLSQVGYVSSRCSFQKRSDQTDPNGLPFDFFSSQLILTHPK